MPFSEAVDPSGFLLLSETDVNTNTSFIAVAIQLLTTFGALPRMIAEYGGYMPKLGISDNETKRSLGIFQILGDYFCHALLYTKCLRRETVAIIYSSLASRILLLFPTVSEIECPVQLLGQLREQLLFECQYVTRIANQVQSRLDAESFE